MMRKMLYGLAISLLSAPTAVLAQDTVSIALTLSYP